jgi:uncharacterized membrane protein
MTCHATLISSTVPISWLATCVHFFFVYLRFLLSLGDRFSRAFPRFSADLTFIDISTLVSLHVELVGCVLSNACYRFPWYEVLRGGLPSPSLPHHAVVITTKHVFMFSFLFSVNVYVIMNNVVGRTTKFHTVHTQHYAFVYSLHMRDFEI